jgi:hypothetical protein
VGFEAARMNDEHIGASLISYKGQLFVFGGDGSKKIETLDLNELPLKWKNFVENFLTSVMIIKLSFTNSVSFTLVDIFLANRNGPT